jgi:fluoride ion exporter CrcB/FEX
MLETQRLVEDGAVRAGAVNAVLSMVVGVAAAALGRTIGAHL